MTMSRLTGYVCFLFIICGLLVTFSPSPANADETTFIFDVQIKGVYKSGHPHRKGGGKKYSGRFRTRRATKDYSQRFRINRGQSTPRPVMIPVPRRTVTPIRQLPTSTATASHRQHQVEETEVLEKEIIHPDGTREIVRYRHSKKESQSENMIHVPSNDLKRYLGSIIPCGGGRYVELKSSNHTLIIQEGNTSTGYLSTWKKVSHHSKVINFSDVCSL